MQSFEAEMPDRTFQNSRASVLFINFDFEPKKCSVGVLRLLIKQWFHVVRLVKKWFVIFLKTVGLSSLKRLD